VRQWARIGVEMLEDRAVPSTFNTPLANGTNAHYLAAGDFTGNGLTDLAVTDSSGSTIQILLSNGDGTFSPDTLINPTGTISVGPNPVVPEAADLGNGHIDLIVPNSGNGTITILLGDGTGNFTPDPDVSYDGTPGVIYVGGSPPNVAIADFGNGHPDIAVTNTNGGGYVTVLLGNGDGSFNPSPIVLQVPGTPGLDDIAVGDFDEANPHPDIAVGTGMSSPGGVYEFLNTSSGGVVSFNTSTIPQIDDVGGPGLVAGYFGNGHDDLAVVNNPNNNNQVDVLLGDGTGAFPTIDTTVLATIPAWWRPATSPGTAISTWRLRASIRTGQPRGRTSRCS
jgi:hypothetical protein